MTWLRSSLLISFVCSFALGCKASAIKGTCLPGRAYELPHAADLFAEAPPKYDLTQDIVVRPLGGAGMYLEWKGHGVLFSPTFTRTDGDDPVVSDPAAITHGLQNLPRERVRAVFAGRSSADRLADLVDVTKRLPDADLFVTQSGKMMLGPYLEELSARNIRVKAINGRDYPRISANPMWVQKDNGDPTPIRIRAIPFLQDERLEPLHEPFDVPWDELSAEVFEANERYAFVVELYDDDRREIEYKLLVADAGNKLVLDKALTEPPPRLALDEAPSPAEDGNLGRVTLGSIESASPRSDDGLKANRAPIWPPPLPRHKGQFDLVVLSVREFAGNKVDPAQLLLDARAGRVMWIDYDEADRRRGHDVELLLADELAPNAVGSLVCGVDPALSAVEYGRPHPRSRTTSVGGRRWFLPLPGQWMVMPTREPPEPAPMPKQPKRRVAKKAPPTQPVAAPQGGDHEAELETNAEAERVPDGDVGEPVESTPSAEIPMPEEESRPQPSAYVDDDHALQDALMDPPPSDDDDDIIIYDIE